jgi:RNA-directed DNA polymerase
VHGFKQKCPGSSPFEISCMLFSEEIWTEWSEKIERDFKIKGYVHFDYQFDFPSRKHEIKDLVAEPEKLKKHPFLPLVKMQVKTPRFRYQDELKGPGLETKKRPISFASHFDTYLYSYYSFSLTKKYQDYIKANDFDEAVLAYRSDLNGKCNIQFAQEAFEYIKAKGACTVVTLDIKGYFDSIDHSLLKEKWCKVLGVDELPADQYKIFRTLTKYTYANRNTLLKHFGIKIKKLPSKIPNFLAHIPGTSFLDKFKVLREHNLLVKNETHELLPDGFKRYYGIPQGSAISALLSNMYLIDYDKEMQEKASKEGFLYKRYCDDILIVCDTRKAYELQEFAINKIKDCHLVIQPRKTELIEFCNNSKGQMRGFNLKKIAEELPSTINSSNEQHFYKSIQYLGFEFNGKDILIRSSSLSRYFRKMKKRIGKTVRMAYSANSRGDKIFKQQLFHRYTHLGKKNFLHYAYNASKEFYSNSRSVKRKGMNSPAIKKQLSRHFDILLNSLNLKNEARAKRKGKKLLPV